MAAMSSRQLFRVLLANGAEVNAVQDYSSASGTFGYTVPAGKLLILRSIVVSMVFTGKTDVLYYGPVDGGLTNGISIKVVTNDARSIPLTPRDPIKSNYDLGFFGTRGSALQQDIDATKKNEQGYLAVTLDMADLLPQRENIEAGLRLAAGAKVEAVLNDDFATPAILRHQFELNGRLTEGG